MLLVSECLLKSFDSLGWRLYIHFVMFFSVSQPCLDWRSCAHGRLVESYLDAACLLGSVLFDLLQQLQILIGFGSLFGFSFSHKSILSLDVANSKGCLPRHWWAIAAGCCHLAISVLQCFSYLHICPVVIRISVHHHRQLPQRSCIEPSFSVTPGNREPRLRLHLQEELLLLPLIVPYTLQNHLHSPEALINRFLKPLLLF